VDHLTTERSRGNVFVCIQTAASVAYAYYTFPLSLYCRERGRIYARASTLPDGRDDVCCRRQVNRCTTEINISEELLCDRSYKRQRCAWRLVRPL